MITGRKKETKREVPKVEKPEVKTKKPKASD